MNCRLRFEYYPVSLQRAVICSAKNSFCCCCCWYYHSSSRDGGTAWTATQVHAVNLIEIRLRERWQPISNQSWMTGSPTTNKADCHCWAPKSRLLRHVRWATYNCNPVKYGYATCMPHKDGGVPLSVLHKDTTSKHAGLFSTLLTFFYAERQARKQWIPFFKVFCYYSTRGMNARSTECEADASTTTPSRRLNISSRIYTHNVLLLLL